LKPKRLEVKTTAHLGCEGKVLIAEGIVQGAIREVAAKDCGD